VKPPTSIYIHIPFCRHRCCYCDFNTYAGLENLIPEYIRALILEIDYLNKNYSLDFPVHTIYFGGGTPSLIPAYLYDQVLNFLAKVFSLNNTMEITIEANPGTLSRQYLGDIRKLGINRLSLGVQSMKHEELRFLERQHDFIDVIRAVDWARKEKFDQINLDLIFGLPHQTLQDWQQSMEWSIRLAPEHFSLYGLSIETGTPLSMWINHGLVQDPDPDISADMYEWSMERLEAEGWTQYEISNWARSSEKGLLVCQHNLQYWRNHPYLGLGAGAHGYVSDQRTVNYLTPMEYIQKLNLASSEKSTNQFPCTPATLSSTTIDRKNQMAETMMMGLRLVRDGVSELEFRHRFDQELENTYAQSITRLSALGLIEWAGKPNDRHLRLTKAGRLLGNQVFVEFI